MSTILETRTTDDSPMEMTALSELHDNMDEQNIDLQAFEVRSGTVSFSCLFSTREDPFKLSLTSTGDNPGFFSFDVSPEHKIDSSLPAELYEELSNALSAGTDATQRLKPAEFLRGINETIPRIASQSNVPDAAQIIKLRADIVEGRELPYLKNWLILMASNPSEDNKLKTLLLKGKEASAFSKTANAISVWSAEPIQAPKKKYARKKKKVSPKIRAQKQKACKA